MELVDQRFFDNQLVYRRGRPWCASSKSCTCHPHALPVTRAATHLRINFGPRAPPHCYLASLTALLWAPGFLVQFGVAANASLQAEWRYRRIADDPATATATRFRRGTVSFAGSGANSRACLPGLAHCTKFWKHATTSAVGGVRLENYYRASCCWQSMRVDGVHRNTPPQAQRTYLWQTNRTAQGLDRRVRMPPRAPRLPLCA